MQPILYPEKGYGLGGIQHINGGSVQFDVERFSRLMNSLERATDYKPDLQQLGEAIFEKSLSKLLPRDGLYGLPLTEDISYLIGLPKEFGLNADTLDLVKRYGEANRFTIVAIATMNRAIILGRDF
jgi:hypothetical protein